MFSSERFVCNYYLTGYSESKHQSVAEKKIGRPVQTQFVTLLLGQGNSDSRTRSPFPHKYRNYLLEEMSERVIFRTESFNRSATFIFYELFLEYVSFVFAPFPLFSPVSTCIVQSECMPPYFFNAALAIMDFKFEVLSIAGVAPLCAQERKAP